MKDNTLRINEIFYSIQGEGYWTGTPMVFVRLSGCNLRCPFCDTDHASFTLMTPAEIMAEVMKYPTCHVVITGGEPSLQSLDLLVDMLHDRGRTVHIETNGTNPLPETLDWITCSPKHGGEVVLERIDELKLVYEGENVEKFVNKFSRVRHFFLQPRSGENISETVDYVLAHPHWNLSLQTHKLINIQ